MSFRRSNAGISNYKRFFKVDYIAYVEGKTDLQYWESLFSIFRPQLRVRFEKKDGIENLKDIVEGVLHGEIQNVFVCRDADYRPLIGNDQIHPRLLRTYGYSYENDFVTEEAAAAVARLIAPRPIDENFIKRAFRRYTFRLSKVGEAILRMDVSFAAVGEGLMSRKNPRDLMTGDEKSGYVFATLEAKQRYRERIKKGERGSIDFAPHGQVFPRYYCGHSIFFVFLTWCRAVVENRCGRPQNASNGVIKNHLLSHYNTLVRPATRDYMEAQLADL
ncbi:DUF4435 domain-containing protein [Georhizobium sp. MAB10]|uniref:DUF4435 domain-containing protein n=1 Tax=Georhizobium sp. MAB10 TaxID=3028319 RepID=UPI0038560C46